MERRNFIKAGSIAGLTITALLSSSCNERPEQTHAKKMKASNDADFELNELTIDELQQKMQDKSYTSKRLTELYLHRIEEIDKSGPKLNSVIELNPDALSIADKLDRERAAGKVRGPLHGIPVLIKDNINTGDQMHTTAGSLALADNRAARDAFIVKQLRAAGAVILGKTNLSEWANFRSSHSTSGWSSRGGQTKCPYILDRNPSGSSAGSGTSASANLCAIAIGTETDGSIVSPASVNGLVGIKPTVGVWSRTGIIPISATQDTAGPMTRTVKDAAILLGALTGIDPEDQVTENSAGKTVKDYTQYLDVDGLKGKRLGLEKSALKSNAATEALLNEALETLRKKGAIIIEVDLFKALTEVDEEEYTVLLYEFKDGLNKYLSTVKGEIKSLADVIAFNHKNGDQTMPYFKQEILELAQTKGGLASGEYLTALNKSHTLSRNIIDKLIKSQSLDAFIAPTNGFAACTDLVNGNYGTGFSFSSPAAISGYPHITVPMGSYHDLPMGLSFFSTAYTEPELIKMAYSYEQASKKRVAPQFKPSLLI
jgi:amidase